MQIHIFVLKKDHQGVKAGNKRVLDENDMEFFEETRMEQFYSRTDDKWITLDLSDSDLFEKTIAERTKVTVEDLMIYLKNNFDSDSEVSLDKDGWNQDYIDHKDVQDLIKQRGVFSKWTYKEKPHLTINN